MPPKTKLYVVVTDGHRFLGTQTSNGISVPNHTMWSMFRKVPQAHWPIQLLRFVTYELFNFGVTYDKPVGKVFGLPPEANFAVFRVAADFLSQVVSTCKIIKRWHKYNAKYDCPWTWRAVGMQIMPQLLTIETYFCLQAIQAPVENMPGAAMRQTVGYGAGHAPFSQDKGPQEAVQMERHTINDFVEPIDEDV